MLRMRHADRKSMSSTLLAIFNDPNASAFAWPVLIPNCDYAEVVEIGCSVSGSGISGVDTQLWVPNPTYNSVTALWDGATNLSIVANSSTGTCSSGQTKVNDRWSNPFIVPGTFNTYSSNNYRQKTVLLRIRKGGLTGGSAMTTHWIRYRPVMCERELKA